MLLKTKDRAWKTAGEAGMSMKTKGILAESGNVAENKGRKWYVVSGRWGIHPHISLLPTTHGQG